MSPDTFQETYHPNWKHVSLAYNHTLKSLPQKLPTQLALRRNRQPSKHVSRLLRLQRLARGVQITKFLRVLGIHDGSTPTNLALHLGVHDTRPYGHAGDIGLLSGERQG